MGRGEQDVGELEDLERKADDWRDQAFRNSQALNAAYRERAHLVAHLAAQYPSHIGYTDPTEPDWAVVIIEAPGGQLSWHVAPDDMDLFRHVKPTGADSRRWDGHTTEEKYARLDRLTDAKALEA